MKIGQLKQRISTRGIDLRNSEHSDIRKLWSTYDLLNISVGF